MGQWMCFLISWLSALFQQLLEASLAKAFGAASFFSTPWLRVVNCVKVWNFCTSKPESVPCAFLYLWRPTTVDKWRHEFVSVMSAQITPPLLSWRLIQLLLTAADTAPEIQHRPVIRKKHEGQLCSDSDQRETVSCVWVHENTNRAAMTQVLI